MDFRRLPLANYRCLFLVASEQRKQVHVVEMRLIMSFLAAAVQ